MATDQGWDILFERPEQSQIRFVRNEIRMDVWNGKKGITVAVFNDNGSVKWFKYVTESKFDQLLSEN